MDAPIDSASTPWPRRTFCWLLVAACVVYASSLFAPFYYDDLHSIVRNPHLKLEKTAAFFQNPSLFDENPRTRMYRPMLLVSYAIDDYFWGRKPFGFHLTNLLLHLLVAVVCYRLLRAILPARSAADRTRRDWAAAIGAGAFLLHPLASEGVIYVSCRSSILATLGYLGALLCIVHMRRASRSSAPRRRAVAWGVCAVSCGILAFGSKAIAITLPAAALLLEWVLARTDRGAAQRPTRLRSLAGAAIRVAPLAILAIAYLVIRREVMGSTGVNLSAARFYESGGHALTGGRSVLSNLYTQAVVFWEYVRLVLAPLDLNIAHHVAVLEAFGDPKVWWSVVGLGLGAVAAIVCLWRAPLVGFALAWMPLTLSPTSSIIPLNVIMNEHRMYLPLTLTLGIGVACAVRAMARWSETPRRLPREAVIAVAILLGFWGLRTAFRSLDYLEPRTLWGKAVEASPGNFRARNYLGNALVAENDLMGAREQYRAAVAIYPDQLDTRVNLGEVNLRIASHGLDRGAWRRTEAIFQSVIEDQPGHVLARLKLGRFLVNRGLVFASEADLDRAEQLFLSVVHLAKGERFKDYRVWAWLRISRLAEQRGRIDEAVTAMKRILEINPGHAATKRRIARLHAMSRLN